MEKSTSRVYQRLNLYMIHRNMHTLQESKYIILIMMNRVAVRVNSEVEKSEKKSAEWVPHAVRCLDLCSTDTKPGVCNHYYSCWQQMRILLFLLTKNA